MALLRTPKDALFFNLVMDSIVDGTNVQLVGVAQSPGELIRWLDEVDAIVMAADSCDRTQIATLLLPSPGPRVVTLPRDGGDAAVHELKPRVTEISELSLDELREVLAGRLPLRAREVLA